MKKPRTGGTGLPRVFLLAGTHIWEGEKPPKMKKPRTGGSGAFFGSFGGN
jgi:hypothetical protein